MSELNSLVDFLNDSAEIAEDKKEITEEQIEQEINSNPFDIEKFGEELSLQSIKRNKSKLNRPSQNITGYDICSNCIGHVLFKLRNTPIPNYSDPWLPIYLRTELGNAVHNFIQNNTNQFSEVELNLKVPSIGFFGKADYAIGDNILGEIKSCTYSDYSSIIRKQMPRQKDLIQVMTYHYMIENYLSEIKDPSTTVHYGGKKPLLDKYNFKQLQFIYVAHDINTADIETYAEMVELVKKTKKTFNSKNNPFFFITSILVDLDDELVTATHDFIKNKIEDIHKYQSSMTFPDSSSRFVDHSSCYFCPYNQICQIKNN